MSASTTPADIAKLGAQVSRLASSDRTARKTDATMHLRKAIELLEGCHRSTPNLTRVAELLVEAADLLDVEAT